MLKVPTSATDNVATEIVFPETVSQVFGGEKEKVFAPQKFGFDWAVAIVFGNGVVCVTAVAAIW